MPIDEDGEPRLSNLDQAPQPVSPEELRDFKDLVLAKVGASDMAVKYKDPYTDIEKTAAKWVPQQNIEVHAEIGAAHEPECVDILKDEHLGRANGIDTFVRKHFRYFPNAEVSEYEEELAEYFNGKRLISEEVQRLKEQMADVDEESMNEEARRMIEHARDFGNMYRGSGIPPLDKNTLGEVIALLAQCDPANEMQAPTFV